jgi:hypothetical protein
MAAKIPHIRRVPHSRLLPMMPSSLGPHKLLKVTHKPSRSGVAGIPVLFAGNFTLGVTLERFAVS